MLLLGVGKVVVPVVFLGGTAVFHQLLAHVLEPLVAVLKLVKIAMHHDLHTRHGWAQASARAG